MTKRFAEDSYARLKYDRTADIDEPIIARAAEIADSRGVSMTEISLAWLLGRVTAPVTGATKISHVEGAARAAALTLTPEETAYLDELYLPHPLAGVMAQNTPAAARAATSGLQAPRRSDSVSAHCTKSAYSNKKLPGKPPGSFCISCPA